MNGTQTTTLAVANSATWDADNAIRNVIKGGVDDAAKAKLDEALKLLAEVRKTLDAAYEVSK